MRARRGLVASVERLEDLRQSGANSFRRKGFRPSRCRLGAAIAALVWVNSPWGSSYDSLWSTELSLRVGDVGLEGACTLGLVGIGGALLSGPLAPCSHALSHKMTPISRKTCKAIVFQNGAYRDRTGDLRLAKRARRVAVSRA